MKREYKIIFILWLVLLAQGIIYALIQPVWSRVDEAQHYHYVQYLSQNLTLPTEGQTFVSPEVVDVSLKSNQWGWRAAGELSTPVYLNPSAWITVPGELDDQAREKWVRRNLWEFNYESMQPPLYYAINVPVYTALPDDSFIKLYGMRLLSALLASAMVPLTWLTAREAYPESRLVVYGAPVAMLMVQGYALNMSQITNDALTVPLTAGAVLLLLRMVARGFTWRRSLVIGLVIGAALLTKMTTIFLLPVTLAALALPVLYKREKTTKALAQAVIIYGIAAAVLMPWITHNFVVYGDATGASAARPLMSSFFISPLESISSLRLDELLPTFWFGEPVFPFPFWAYAWVAVGTAMVVAILGILYYYFSAGGRATAAVPGSNGAGQTPDARLPVNFMVAAFVVGVAFNLLIPFGSGIGGIPGRYLYPLIPAAAFLLVFGMEQMLARERARFMAEVLLVWMVVWESLNFLAYIQNR